MGWGWGAVVVENSCTSCGKKGREEILYFLPKLLYSPAILHTDWVADCGCGGVLFW